MTTRFLNGPAKGVRLELRRFPLFLRVVHDGRAWKWDALDQLDDSPKPTETLFVYRLDGRCVSFVCGRGVGGCRMSIDADYHFHLVQPTQDTARDGVAWREWAEREYDRLSLEAPATSHRVDAF